MGEYLLLFFNGGVLITLFQWWSIYFPFFRGEGLVIALFQRRKYSCFLQSEKLDWQPLRLPGS
jgi:hypothetical protein